MRNIKYVIAVLVLLGFTIQAQAKDKEAPKVYMFGFAASFNDSTIYLTDIQEVTGAYMAEKTKFLVNRDEYSYQLRNYLQGQGKKFPTCITSYAYNRKDVMKKYDKIKKRYIDKNKGRYIIVNIDSTQFTYKPVSPDEGTLIVDSNEAAEAAKKSNQKSKKAPKGKKR